MLTGYDLENPEELYNFSSDCDEACCYCPQYNTWNPIDFDAGRNEVSPSEVFIWWKEDVGGQYLFEYGYYSELSEEAQNTFRRYINQGKEIDSNVFDLYTGKLLSKESIQILIFRGV